MHHPSLVTCKKKILMKRYEIAVIEQKLNAAWRVFLQLESKFNLELIGKNIRTI